MLASNFIRVGSTAGRRAFSQTAVSAKAVRSHNLLALGGIGVLSAAAISYSLFHTSHADSIFSWSKSKSESTPALTSDGKFHDFVLKSVQPVNHNTKIYRFALPEGATHLGLPTASAVVTKFVKGTKADGKPDVVIRPYTPIEDPKDGNTGHFDLLVKKYPNGPMSTHIDEMAVGDKLSFKGPIPKFPYKANEFKHIGMMAGGTGITPMMQLIQRILANPEDKTKMTLLFANATEEDILLKSYFDGLVTSHKGQLEVIYFVEKPSKSWSGSTGYVNEATVKSSFPAPGAGKVFICGPTPMLTSLSGSKAPDYSQGEVGGLLKKLGYTEKDVYKF